MVFVPRTAAASAASTSPVVARGTVSTTELSYGCNTSIFSLLSTHFPPTHIFMTHSPSSRPSSLACAIPGKIYRLAPPPPGRVLRAAQLRPSQPSAQQSTADSLCQCRPHSHATDG